jgi:antitoxin (DNA-binding transcriptional repressor) of toxin-antitoxin stability system
MELAAAGAEIHVTRRGKPYVRLLGHQQTLTAS